MKWLVVILRALRVDPADFHLRHAEGTQSAADVVVVEDVGVCHEIGLPVTQGLDFCSRTVGLDDGGVAGAETASAGTVILQVLDAHPPGVKRGVEERGTITGEGGKGEDDDVTGGGGAHAYIVTDGRRKVKCRRKEIYLF